jgi:hypothetical protein
MNSKTLVNHYTQLTPQERFRLILAAIRRDDDVEHERLTNAGKRITLLSAHLVSKFGELRRANKSTVVNRGRDAEEAQKLTLQG